MLYFCYLLNLRNALHKRWSCSNALLFLINKAFVFLVEEQCTCENQYLSSWIEFDCYLCSDPHQLLWPVWTTQITPAGLTSRRFSWMSMFCRPWSVLVHLESTPLVELKWVYCLAGQTRWWTWTSRCSCITRAIRKLRCCSFKRWREESTLRSTITAALSLTQRYWTRLILTQIWHLDHRE